MRKSENRFWKVCRNLAIVWAIPVIALYLYRSPGSEATIMMMFGFWAIVGAPLLAVGLAFRS